MDEEACRLVFFALKHRHARHKQDQGHVLDDLPRDGPASLVVPRHPVAVQRRGILRRQGRLVMSPPLDRLPQVE